MDERILLKMENISKSFAGVKALDDVRLEVRRGEIHALIGENGAGKSTLMKILLGIYSADSGSISYKGKEVSFHSPHDALNKGISMVHQEISLTHSMTVSENVWLGREHMFTRFGLLDAGKRNKRTKELLDGLGIKLNPGTVVNALTVAQMQLVELARAVSYEPEILILDEPTSALSSSEIELLFDIVRRLAAKGTGVVFISHKLDEIFRLCDKITIMRDGHYVDARASNDISMDELINLIAGRKLKQNIRYRQDVKHGKEVLRVEKLTREGIFRDVSFSVRAGEIVGFSGLMGAGRSEIMRAIYGLDRYDSGKIYLDGKEKVYHVPEAAVADGIGMVTEDRLRTGILPTLSIMQNTTIANMRGFTKFGFMNAGKEKAMFNNASRSMTVKYTSYKDTITKLSGGNQQKVILSRWISNNPRVLILDEPTRGIDVGAKAEIYGLIHKLAQNGIAIIMVSSEMPELLSTCDRIYVVRDGEIVHESSAEDATQELLAKHAFGA